MPQANAFIAINYNSGAPHMMIWTARPQAKQAREAVRECWPTRDDGSLTEWRDIHRAGVRIAKIKIQTV